MLSRVLLFTIFDSDDGQARGKNCSQGVGCSFLCCFSEQRAHVLSAREPTIVPKIMDDPKPAMKRRPMSPLSKP